MWFYYWFVDFLLNKNSAETANSDPRPVKAIAEVDVESLAPPNPVFGISDGISLPANLSGI